MQRTDGQNAVVCALAQAGCTHSSTRSQTASMGARPRRGVPPDSASWVTMARSSVSSGSHLLKLQRVASTCAVHVPCSQASKWGWGRWITNALRERSRMSSSAVCAWLPPGFISCFGPPRVPGKSYMYRPSALAAIGRGAGEHSPPAGLRPYGQQESPPRAAGPTALGAIPSVYRYPPRRRLWVRGAATDGAGATRLREQPLRTKTRRLATVRCPPPFKRLAVRG
jgi:hypothetical protein